MRIAGLLAALLIAIPSLPLASAFPLPPCQSLTGTNVSAFHPASTHAPLEGYLASPTGTPTKLVVFSHGFRYRACDASTIAILDALSHQGALAVAMDFRGAWDSFKVHAGIGDNLDAIAQLRTDYPSITTVIAWGFSMGGLVTELLARDHPGTVDYTVIDSAISNLLETYTTIPVGGVPFGCLAGDCLDGLTIQQAIAAEYGDPIANLGAYIVDSPALTASGFASTPKLTRAVLIYAAGDPYVTVDQGVVLATALTLQGVPTELYIVPSVFHTPWAFWATVHLLGTPSLPPLPLLPGIFLCSPLAPSCAPIFAPLPP